MAVVIARDSNLEPKKSPNVTRHVRNVSTQLILSVPRYRAAQIDATAHFLGRQKGIINVLPHERRNKSELVNQVPHARALREEG